MQLKMNMENGETPVSFQIWLWYLNLINIRSLVVIPFLFSFIPSFCELLSLLTIDQFIQQSNFVPDLVSVSLWWLSPVAVKSMGCMSTARCWICYGQNFDMIASALKDSTVIRCQVYHIGGRGRGGMCTAVPPGRWKSACLNRKSA